MLCVSDHKRSPLHVRTARVFEQSHAEFERQQAGAGRVDLALCQSSAVDGLDGSLVEFGGGHHDVVASPHGGDGGFGVVRADLLLDYQPPDVVPVCHHHALEAPLVFQDFGQQPMVAGRRHTLDGLVARHEGHGPGLHRALEGRQEVAPQLTAREVRLRSVAPTLGLGIAGVVFGRGEDSRWVVQTLTLITADHRRCQFTDQVGVLAEGLAGAAPAQITRQAQDRGEGPVDAGGDHLGGRHPRHPFQQGGIPTTGQRQLGGEDGRALPERMPVDGVLADQQRNPQTVLGGQLHGLAGLLAPDMQDRPGLAGVDEGQVIGTRVPHDQLADLLLQGHAAEQVGHAFFDAQGWVAVGRDGFRHEETLQTKISPSS